MSTTARPKRGKRSLLADPSYDPNHLLDVLIEKLGLKNDAELCRELGVWPPLISKIRHRKHPVGSALLVAMHETSGMRTRELRALMGDRRQFASLSGSGTGRAGQCGT